MSLTVYPDRLGLPTRTLAAGNALSTTTLPATHQEAADTVGFSGSRQAARPAPQFGGFFDWLFRKRKEETPPVAPKSSTEVSSPPAAPVVAPVAEAPRVVEAVKPETPTTSVAAPVPAPVSVAEQQPVPEIPPPAVETPMPAVETPTPAEKPAVAVPKSQHPISENPLPGLSELLKQPAIEPTAEQTTQIAGLLDHLNKRFFERSLGHSNEATEIIRLVPGNQAGNFDNSLIQLAKIQKQGTFRLTVPVQVNSSPLYIDLDMQGNILAAMYLVGVSKKEEKVTAHWCEDRNVPVSQAVVDTVLQSLQALQTHHPYTSPNVLLFENRGVFSQPELVPLQSVLPPVKPAITKEALQEALTGWIIGPLNRAYFCNTSPEKTMTLTLPNGTLSVTYKRSRLRPHPDQYHIQQMQTLPNDSCLTRTYYVDLPQSGQKDLLVSVTERWQYGNHVQSQQYGQYLGYHNPPVTDQHRSDLISVLESALSKKAA